MEGNPHLARQHERLAREVDELAEKVKLLRRERSENDAVLESMARRLARHRAGGSDDPRAHIRHAARPVPPAEMRFSRAAELFAALSTSLLLAGVAALTVFAPGYALSGAIVLLIAVLVAESVLRATFVRTVNRIAVVLALVAAVILVIHFWRPVLLAALVGLAIFLLLQRIRELRA
jgi:hypothetical protein